MADKQSVDSQTGPSWSSNIPQGVRGDRSTSRGLRRSQSPGSCPGLCGRARGAPGGAWGWGVRWWTPHRSYWRLFCCGWRAWREGAPFFAATPPSPHSEWRWRRRDEKCLSDEQKCTDLSYFFIHLLSRAKKDNWSCQLFFQVSTLRTDMCTSGVSDCSTNLAIYEWLCQPPAQMISSVTVGTNW